MKKIRKLTAIQPVHLLPETMEAVREYCEEAVFYDTEPESDRDVISRIQDSDAVFVSYNRAIGEEILSACPDLKYIGMCCSLYSPESSNVDILYAKEHGITVTGIRDYGDEGVAEYVISELIRRLHDLLRECDVICSCLSKNVTLLYDKEFEILGGDKVIFNTALSPCFEKCAMEKWLEKENTWYYCDTLMGLGDPKLDQRKNVRCQMHSSGMTSQAVKRLNEKVMDNLKKYCNTL